jgi:hypothetical protein
VLSSSTRRPRGPFLWIAVCAGVVLTNTSVAEAASPAPAIPRLAPYLIPTHDSAALQRVAPVARMLRVTATAVPTTTQVSALRVHAATTPARRATATTPVRPATQAAARTPVRAPAVARARATATPTPRVTPRVTPRATPRPPARPAAKATATPKPRGAVPVRATATPQKTVAKARVTATSKATVKPRATATPKPRVTAKPAATVTAKPKAAVKPRVTATPKPKATVKAKATATPKPKPTAKPKATVKPKASAPAKPRATALSATRSGVSRGGARPTTAATPIPVEQGIAMHYYPGLFQTVARNQGFTMRKDVDGYASRQRCAELGRIVEARLRNPFTGRWGPWLRYQVLDCSAPQDVAYHRDIGLILEVDYDSAARAGFAGAGRTQVEVKK